VSVNGQPVQPRLSLSDTVLELPLVAPLEIGESLRIDLEFAGTVPVEFGGEDESGGYGIYNYSQGVLALSGWYPILAVYDQDGWNLDPVSVIGDSVYSDTAFYTVDITADKDLRLATTGEEIEGQDLNGDIRRRYVSGPVRDFFLIMSPDFQVTSQEVDGVQVNSYYLPEHPQGGDAALDVTAQSLHIFNQYFGEYPFDEIDVVEAPMRYALGVEYPGIFLVASDLYADPAQDNFLVATAHEVAHQWWYSVVGNDVFDEPWLDESMATYSSSLYYQDAINPSAYRAFTSYWKDRLSDLREDSLDDQVTQSLGYFEALDTPRVYGTVVYTKGALFFDALREEIGDEAFFGALQNYYQRYKYQIAETEDLLAEFEASAGRQLDDLYQEWLFAAEE
jgi:aminopeptidase N